MKCKSVKDFLRPYYHVFKYFIPFLVFNIKLLFRKKYKIKTKNCYKGNIAVLANGPSLKEVIANLETAPEFKDCDFIVMNLFALEPKFRLIKPQHYCLSDPMFYQDYQPRLNDIKKMFDIFQNNVDWEMNLYLSFPSEKQYKMFLRYSKLTNPMIRIVKANLIDYDGYERFRNFYYNSGYCMPRVGTVANLAIYIAILNGYKDIKLYGVDHDFFLSWAINDNNELCAKEVHFYQNENEVKLKPIIDTISGKGTIKIATYLWILSVWFKSHEDLSKFANYKNAEIINMTKGSMIDSYKRKK